jgi:hypothetical protein
MGKLAACNPWGRFVGWVERIHEGSTADGGSSETQQERLNREDAKNAKNAKCP